MVRKHKGINQQTGRLKKGYKYSGRKLSNGLSEIVKINKSVARKKTCKQKVSSKIKKTMKEYKKGRWSRKQAIAVAYSMVKKQNPGCKRILQKK